MLHNNTDKLNSQLFSETYFLFARFVMIITAPMTPICWYLPHSNIVISVNYSCLYTQHNLHCITKHYVEYGPQKYVTRLVVWHVGFNQQS